MAAFEIVGNCPVLEVTAGGNCIGTKTYGNSQSCNFKVNRQVRLTVPKWSVERMGEDFSSVGGDEAECYDYVDLAGREYCGGHSPANQVVRPGQTLRWKTNGRVTAGGWKICVDPLSGPEFTHAVASECRGSACGFNGQYCPPGVPGSSSQGYCCKANIWVDGSCGSDHIVERSQGYCSDYIYPSTGLRNRGQYDNESNTAEGCMERCLALSPDYTAFYMKGTQCGCSRTKSGACPVVRRNAYTTYEIQYTLSDIIACGGNTDPGQTCKFPFTYKGVTHDTCTTEGHDQPWCYTVENGSEGSPWGNCNCPARHRRRVEGGKPARAGTPPKRRVVMERLQVKLAKASEEA